MEPSAPPSPVATHSPVPRLGVALTERGSLQGEAAGAQVASNRQERPHIDMLLHHDSQRSSDHEGSRFQGLEEHHESPDGGRTGRHSPPPTLPVDISAGYYHVERLVRRGRHQGQIQYLEKWREYLNSENSWEFEAPLRQDCPDAVDAFDQKYQAPRHQTSGAPRQ
ncbi:Heterochromatin-associated protein HP1 and related CHROMO domain proteins [Plasmopara halstedii]|uniref:Heterochromatin-associated protein HP1 and related CHROMO domain proteins n=1 Tax=Plasmopara halstedii TaxID=4781 RepID=A0A0P1AK39_PLAHL|nr:Heterochromatin-associated protein HP1 and related CHROMO domain proteins [Plasmopara halstedii]CEG41377.1 Heterochromatin-associated protein HP1 and related CHROMO domain proteins [Plasmopara halstedii]|eukprot:XP_024577746.1 Heterochromatin-associated protein HP1 and related CHROMO domain proteins [Plasmopara halstedii]